MPGADLDGTSVCLVQVRFTCVSCTGEIHSVYCKTLFFRRILISRFPVVENLLRFNLADFPVNFIKQFVSCFF